MKNKRLWLISMAMSIALLGLISIQVYWVKNGFEVNREKFFRKVDDKMDLVIKKHEVLQTLDLIDDFDRRGFIGTSNFETQRKVVSQGDSNEVTFKKFEINVNEVIFESDPTGQIKMQTENQQPVDYNQRDKDKRNDNGNYHAHLVKKDSQEVNFDELRRTRDGELFRLMTSFLRVYQSKDKSISEKYLDSLLSFELKQVHPHLAYEYEIIENAGDSIDSLYNEGYYDNYFNNSIRKNLFPSSIHGDQSELILNILGPTKFILSEMKLVLFSSAFFLLIIIYAFSYTLNSLVKQGKLSEMKSDFINNMTHELKTPITSISLATEALLDKNIEINPEKVSRLSRLIAKENDRLKSQVDRVLQMERLDRKRIKLDKSQIEIDHLLGDILQSVGIQVESKSGIIHSELKAPGIKILADELHIGNVFYNLIDNAIKYSLNGIEIDIKTWVTGKRVFVQVADKGIGIPKDLQAKIFERFYRVPTGNRHDVKGFGLGLSYVKEMIELHKGTITIQSKIGKGSTFIISLPIINQEI